MWDRDLRGDGGLRGHYGIVCGLWSWFLEDSRVSTLFRGQISFADSFPHLRNANLIQRAVDLFSFPQKTSSIPRTSFPKPLPSPLSHSRPHTTLPTQRKHTGREQDIPFALGSCVLNLLCAFVDTLGVPVLRFIENLRLASDIFFSISRADSAIFAVLLGFGLGSRLAGRFRGLVIRRGCCSRKCRKEELA